MSVVRLGHHDPSKTDYGRSRIALLDMLISESEANGDGDTIRIGRPTRNKGGMQWSHVTRMHDPWYSYRTILRNQVVWDVGDHTVWTKTRIHTHSLWKSLEWHGSPFWGSVSGGKGTHTEVFLPNWANKEQRRCFVDTIFSTATYFLHRTPFARGIEYDPLLILPRPGSRMVREFGESKGAGLTKKKSLWAENTFRPLPNYRPEAYSEGTPTVIPAVIPKVPDDIFLRIVGHNGIKELTGGQCPQGPQCTPGPHWDKNEFWQVCQDCPIRKEV